VEEFGFGFPPRIFSRKIGDTLYTLNLIPLGGFVRLFGESGSDAGAKDSFAHQPFRAKIGIVLAGVVSNVVLSLTILTVLLSIGTAQPLTRVYPGATIAKQRLYVAQVLPKGPADEAGIAGGDSVLTVNGTAVTTVEALQGMVEKAAGAPVMVEIERKKEVRKISVTPKALPELDGRRALGVVLEPIATIRYPFYLAPFYAAAESWQLTKEMLVVLKTMAQKLIVQRSVRNVGVTGPIGIAVLSGRVARAGIESLLYFIALLSLNLALLNVLPLPALDGGRGAILIGERIVGKRLERRIETVIQLTGIAFIITIALMVTIEDLRMYAPMFANAFTR